MNSYEKLNEAVNQTKSKLCIGLDTDINKLPKHFKKEPESILDFNREMIEATSDLVPAYKINFAFYERYGIKGFEILKKTFEAIPEDKFTIADAKRGDIGNTSKAYAESVFEYFNADSVTVNPLMGYDSVAPFLDFKQKIVFLLGLTSNPGSADFQQLNTEEGRLYESIFKTSSKWSPPNQIGYVVGATHPEELRSLRNITPDNPFLIPGIGAQGGSLEEVMKANGQSPALINVSRGVIYASDEKNYAQISRNLADNYKSKMAKFI